MEWEWFDRLADSPNVEQALCASGDGRVLRASRSLTDDIERAAAMLQSVDVLLDAAELIAAVREWLRGRSALR